MTWVTALILMALALPSMLARLTGGYPPNPGPELAALAPLAVVPAVAAMIIAAYAAWWLAALLAIPAALLVMWQLPPLRRARSHAAPGPWRGTGSAAAPLRLRVFTVNVKGGAADPAAIVRILRQHEVDVLAVQELTPSMVTPADSGRTHRSAAVFPSRSPARFARHRLVGALAADAAAAGPGSYCGCAAGADRSTGRACGDADRGTSTRSRARARLAARGQLAA